MRSSLPDGNFLSRPAHYNILIAAFIGMMVLVILGPVMSYSDLPMSGEGNPVRQGAYLFMVAVMIYAVRPLAHPRALLPVPIPLVIALILCAVSLSWAVDPSIAARRLILTAVVIWLVCAAVQQLSFETLIRTLRIMLVILLVANYLAVVISPQIGIHLSNDVEDLNLMGDWRGIMMHKNFAGAACALTMLLFLFDAKAIPRTLRFGVVLAALAFLWLSSSKTSLGMMTAAVVIGYISSHYQTRYRPFLVGILFIGAIAITALLNIYNFFIMGMLNDPKAFTGRSLIWSTMERYSADHRMFGAGYGSFWNIGPYSPINQYGTGWVKIITVGHNGYLDLLVQMGLPLTIVILLLVLIWPFGKLLLSSNAGGERGALLLALFIFCLGHNMTETSILERDSTMEVFLVMTIALIWKITALKSPTASILQDDGLGIGGGEGRPLQPRDFAERRRKMTGNG